MGIDSEGEGKGEKKLFVRWSLGVSSFRRKSSVLGAGQLWVKERVE